MKKPGWFGTPMAAAMVVGLLAGVGCSVFRTFVINAFTSQQFQSYWWLYACFFTGLYCMILLTAPFICLREPRKLMHAFGGGVLIALVSLASQHLPIVVFNRLPMSFGNVFGLVIQISFWGGELLGLAILGAATSWMYGFRVLWPVCAVLAALSLPVRLALQQVMFFFGRSISQAGGPESISATQVDQGEILFYFFNIVGALIVVVPVAFVIERRMKRSLDRAPSTCATGGQGGIFFETCREDC